MIIDLQAFITQEKKVWSDLERMLDRLEADLALQLDLAEVRQFHYLYQRTSADLAKIMTFAAERELGRYLEALVARAYAEIHKSHARSTRLRPLDWLLATLPQTFRRHAGAFWFSLAITLAGTLFGAGVALFDASAKDIIIPGAFAHLQDRPSERVAREERSLEPANAGHQSSMVGFYVSNNTRVSILTFALGLTYGLGTIALLFKNGVILGAVFADYIADGQTRFVFGWLLPHGSFEIPAILIAGQAGLVLAGALIGWGRRMPLRKRLAAVAPDLATLLCGVALMLVWAALLEAFFSQYHEPLIPYSAKISFGCLELALLIFYYSRVGRKGSVSKAK